MPAFLTRHESVKTARIGFATLVSVLLVASVCIAAAQLPASALSVEAQEDVGSNDVCANGICADEGVSLLQRSAVVVQRSALVHNSEKLAERSFGEKLDAFVRVFVPPQYTTYIDGLPARFVSIAMIITWAFCAFYTVCVIWDVSKLWRLSYRKDTTDKLETFNRGEDVAWSGGMIWMLCFYRLYTGFLAATWLPYVLAMEGESFWPNNQALFMGIAKLIYGVTVLMNPMFGLIGDMLAELCQGAARRLWILLGITMSAFGIMVCLWAGPRHDFLTYMAGITLWRVGESLNDVTTEAIVPEMVPTKQFALASSIKAASFIFGGLGGYVLLFFMADVHYTWCYFAYLGAMFTCAIPPLLLLNNEAPGEVNKFRAGNSFAYNMSQSYMVPAKFEGGFPEMSFAIFLMSCGTAPMFFFLLIIRDLVGVHVEIALQQDFAIGSVLFFLSAAASTIMDVTYGDRIGPASRGAYHDANSLAELSPRSRAESVAGAVAWEREKIRRLKVLSAIACVYGASVLALPTVQFIHPLDTRLTCFFPLVVVFGATFGLGYSRFQDATWRLLPRDCDMANAMGFNCMARNFGLGVGNFFFGAMLECFKVHHSVDGTTTTILTTTFTGQVLTTATQVYTDGGYDFMCAGCLVFNLVAAVICYRIVYILPDPDAIAENSATKGS